MTDHIEALPTIDINELMTIGDDEVAHCWWKSPRGLLGGWGEFQWIMPGHRLGLTYGLTRNLPQPKDSHYDGTIELWVLKDQRPEQRLKWWLQCYYECGQARRCLYFLDGKWKCRVCHGLSYASQRTRTSDRKLRRAQGILARISDGRPKGMHNKTYLKLKTQLQKLQQQAQQYDPRVPNKELLQRCVFEWEKRERIARR